MRQFPEGPQDAHLRLDAQASTQNGMAGDIQDLRLEIPVQRREPRPAVQILRNNPKPDEQRGR